MRHAAKAGLAGLIAGLGALGTALTDESVTASEWTAVALATAVALGGVYGVRNRPPVPRDTR